MARIELRGGRQALGRGHRRRAAPTSRSATASSWRSWDRRAAASRRRCSCSPASTSPATATSCSTATRVNEVEARDRNVGIVFQSYALYPHMTVRANIRVPAALQERGRGRGRAPALEPMARLVQVEELLDRRPAQLSGGQQQRVALARALVKEPQLLLLDEPLSNLDASLRLIMRGEIRRLQRSLGVTTILVTHDQIEATTMADRVICMSKGRIEQIGTADDLYQRPDSLFVAGLHRLAADQPAAGRGGAAGRLAWARRSLAVPGPRCRGRSWSASGPSMCAWARATCGPRSSDLEPHGRETIYHLSTALGPLHALEAGAVARYSRRRRACRFAPGLDARVRRRQRPARGGGMSRAAAAAEMAPAAPQAQRSGLPARESGAGPGSRGRLRGRPRRYRRRPPRLPARPDARRARPPAAGRSPRPTAPRSSGCGSARRTARRCPSRPLFLDEVVAAVRRHGGAAGGPRPARRQGADRAVGRADVLDRLGAALGDTASAFTAGGCDWAAILRLADAAPGLRRGFDPLDFHRARAAARRRRLSRPRRAHPGDGTRRRHLLSACRPGPCRARSGA